MASERRDPSAEASTESRAEADDSDSPGDVGTGSTGPGGGDTSHDSGEPWRDWTRGDLVQSAVAGVAAYAAGYALLYLWFLTQGRTAGEAVDWQWVGWIFYHGQFVPLEVSAGSVSAGGAVVAETGLGDLSNVVPGFLLGTAAVAIAGFLLVRDRDVVDPRGAAATGASLVVGYLPLALLGLLVFRGTLPNGVRVSPDPLWGVLLTGLAVPIVGGALGGLAFVARRRRSTDDAERSVESERPVDGERPIDGEPREADRRTPGADRR